MTSPTVNGFTRRQVLRFAFAGTALSALSLPLRMAMASATGTRGEFLSAEMLALAEAIMARIVPSDTLPGAREAGTVDYLQGLLSALPAADGNADRRTSAADFIAILQQLGAPGDGNPDGADVDGSGGVSSEDLDGAVNVLFKKRPIFAGGPFSGRQPFGDFENGHTTDNYPGNSFNSYIPLNRLQRLAWKVRLDGAASVPEVSTNPLATSLGDVDLRNKYVVGLNAIETASQQKFGASFTALTAAQQDEILRDADADFVNLMTEHTVEGLFCAPEYGGNRGLVGWQLIGFDGDSQPLGYTLGFDEESKAYIERPDKPNSRPDPNETCAGFSAGVVRFLSLVISADDTQPAMRFRNPFCFEIG